MEQDLDGICRKQWEKWGRMPREIFSQLTPSQFVALFAQSPGGARFDRVEELIKVNDLRGQKGQRPAIPAWLYAEQSES